jgi:hypothetical protein
MQEVEEPENEGREEPVAVIAEVAEIETTR